MKKVYECQIKGHSVIRAPLVRRVDKVEGHMNDRSRKGGVNVAEREYMNREN